MKLGIIGLPRSGKSTIFEALTQNFLPEAHKKESRVGTIQVPDPRVAVLSDLFKPQKTVYAQVEYFLPVMLWHKKDQQVWAQVRDCDALIHVVRNFGGYGFETPQPYEDFKMLDQELIFTDLVVVERRLERIAQDKQRGKKIEEAEQSLLIQCLQHLESDLPLRKNPELASAHLLKGYTFLTAKPMLVLFNNEDDDEAIPEKAALTFQEECVVIRGKLEQELAQMSTEDAEAFLSEFNISASAMDRVIKRSYELLGLISFFTFVEDEVKAWTVKKGTQALDAADVIHSDMKKGFIRAEVVSFQDLMAAGAYLEAKKDGKMRLEGKTYTVQDGDVITFRFSI